MPIFRNLMKHLGHCFCSERSVVLRFCTDARIPRFAAPLIRKILNHHRDDETYRCAIAQITALEGRDAPHRGRNKDTHRTHMSAAKMLAVSRGRSGGTFRSVERPGGFPAFSKSADRKLAEVAQ